MVIVLLVLSPKLTGSEVFQNFKPLGPKSTLEMIAAQVLLLYSSLGSDSTAHMAEETQHAATVIPRAMVWSYSMVSVQNFVMLITVSRNRV